MKYILRPLSLLHGPSGLGPKQPYELAYPDDRLTNGPKTKTSNTSYTNDGSLWKSNSVQNIPFCSNVTGISVLISLPPFFGMIVSYRLRWLSTLGTQKKNSVVLSSTNRRFDTPSESYARFLTILGMPC